MPACVSPRAIARAALSAAIALTGSILTACADQAPSAPTDGTSVDGVIAASALPIVSNLAATTGKTYQVAPGGLLAGTKLYTDQSYVLQTVVPSVLTGATFVRTASSDKAASPGSTTFLSFDVDRNVTVYVAHDRQYPVPTWMSGWTATGLTLVSSEVAGKQLWLYSKAFAKGHITLGSNVTAGTAGSMYVVVVTQLIGAAPPPASSSDSTKPTVAITAPANAATVTGTVSVTANATDSKGMSSVQFQVDGQSLGSAVTKTPYAASWDSRTAANGTHTLAAVARDAAGNTNTASVQVKVLNVVVTGTHKGWYVSPSGSSSGNGSSTSPWDLQTALNQPSSVHAGDTIWMRAGTYKGTFTSYLTGSPGNPIVLRQYPGERATIDAEQMAFTIQGSDAVYWGFEMTDLNTSRYSSITGPWPSDQNRHQIDIDVYGPRTKFINLIIHDLGNGMGVWNQATDVEVNGCLVYNNGWDGPDRGHGHAIYTQNSTGTKKFIDNILLTSFDHGLQAYGSDAASVVNMVFDGNAAYANGGLDIGGAWNMLVGGSAPTQNITFTNNYAFHPNTVTSAVVGYYGTNNSNLTMTGNYIYPALLLENWSPPVTFANNVIGGMGTILNVYQKSGVSWSGFNFSNNTYMSSEANNPPFAITSGGNQTNYPWTGWRSTTGLDASSSYTKGTPTGTKVIVRPNQYEKGRANIYVVNFNHAGSVTADLSAVLTPGQKFELHNAFNYFAAPVVSGTYNGGAITIPISPQVPVAAIGGSPATPPPSDIFSVWIVIPTS